VVGRPLEERDLVARAKRGDAAAYEELVRRHQGIALRTAYLTTRNESDAQEATQDAFLKAYGALHRFREEAPFRPWLLRIVANEARNRRRSAGRREALVLRASADAASGDAAPSPEAALVSAERRDELLAALNTLGEKHRLTIAYRYLLDLTEEETAAALGVRRGTVKSRVSRALDRLRAELARDGEVSDA
jgi:RNA polymerase sigma-70 factor, ECF subfamily